MRLREVSLGLSGALFYLCLAQSLFGCSGGALGADAIDARLGSGASVAVPQTDHLDGVIDKVLMSSRAAGSTTNIEVAPQLTKIAETEGFKYETLTNAYPYLRDIGILLDDGTMVVPSSEQPALIYARRDHLWTYGPEVTPLMSQGNLALYDTDTLEYYYSLLASELGVKRVRQANIYVEGGNTISLRCQGEPRVVIGRGSLQFTAALMAHKELALGNEIQEIKNSIQAGLPGSLNWPQMPPHNTVVQLRSVARRAQDELNDKAMLKRKYGDSPATETELAELFGLSDTDGYDINIDNFQVSSLYGRDHTGWSNQLDTDFAVTIAAREELAARAIAHELGLRRDQLIPIDQILYHIDLFIRPGPTDVVLVQDPTIDVGLPNLTPTLRDRFENVRSVLEETGCQVVIADGVRFQFEEYANGGGWVRTTSNGRTNLFNGFGGKNPSSKMFFVTNEADAADKSLQASWEQLMANLGVPTTYFIRHDGVPEAGAGISCMTKTSNGIGSPSLRGRCN